MRSEGFSFYIWGSGGWGVDTCSRDPALGVRNRPRTTVVRVKLPCLWPQKHVFLDVSDDVLMSLGVAGVALCDMRCVSAEMCLRDRREGKVAVPMATKTCLFSTCEKMWSCRFAWQTWHFVTCDVFQEECVRATVVAEKVAVSMGKATKTCLSRRVRSCGHVVFRGRRGTL